MSNKKVRIRQSDYLRVILTDMSPYETPFRFSYERLYEIWTDKKYSQSMKDLLIGSDTPEKFPSFVPFVYSIQKGGGETRDLGLIHPHLMRSFVELYDKSDELMLSLCQKSHWSLRKPGHVAKMYVPKFVFPEVTGEADTDSVAAQRPEQEAVIQKSATSFFAYSPHNFLYKFFESRDLFEIERKFRYCKKLDIARCFSNIYTHAISWAIKTKPEGKKEKDSKQTFDQVFDRTIRRANDDETHGILVGPEVSRIFAEILLQQVDLEVLQRCTDAQLSEGKHFTVRRYVDDYFIFYNDDVSLAIVQKHLEERLKHYKLFLNPSKESFSERPFITDLSVCKNELRDTVSVHFRKRRPKKKNERTEPSLISKTRSIIRLHKISYSECSVYMMSQLIKPLLDILEKADINKISDHDEDKVAEILQTAFSLFSIDPRFRTSFLLGKMMIAVSRKYSVCNQILKPGISDTIASEVRGMLAAFVSRASGKRLEISTFLTTLSGIPNIHPLPLDLLESVCIPPLDESGEMSYFLIVTLLDFLSSHASYRTLRDRITKIGMDKIMMSKMPLKDCECFMLAIDLAASPFLQEIERRKIISRLFQAQHKIAPTEQQIAILLSDFLKGAVFFDWGSSADSAFLIAKKELAFTY